MKKLLAVAKREFTSTVMTKGFFFGVVIAPAMMFGVILVTSTLITNRAPKVIGNVAVIDRSGKLGDELKNRISPEAIEKQAADDQAAIEAAVGNAAKRVMDENSAKMATGAAKMAGGVAARDVPQLTIETLAPDANIDAEKKLIKKDMGATDSARLALVVIAPDAAVKAADKLEYGSYELYVMPRLDDRVEDIIKDGVNDALVQARIREANLDSKSVMAITKRPHVRSTTVTAEGERKTSQGAAFLIPFGFIMLLWISSFTGGQYLLTSTIEEKSNRIMEVLLSAVSPLELMIGKIVGQMGVGLLILLIYSSVGAGSVIVFGFAHLLSAQSIGFMIVYFFIAFFLIASLMAAVGSAVSEVHEAQSLLGPIMIVLIVPMMLAMPIIRNPNSTLALTLSFIPPVSPFVMVMRISASTTPIPLWQIAASIAVGLLAVCFAAWAAAKVFRIGVLMYGKPPNFRTLVKWIRMA